MGGIYQIKNTATGAVYIGSTKNFKSRENDHFKMMRAGRHPARHLQNSVIKHGIDAFVFEILLTVCDGALMSAEQAEIDKVIAEFGRKSLYNVSTAADRHEWEEESKELLRQKRIGDKNPFYGKKHTPETCAKMSTSRIGRTAWNKGVQASDEHRAAISASGFGRVQSDETKAKRSATMKRLAEEGKLFGPDHIKAMSAAQIARRLRNNIRTDL